MTEYHLNLGPNDTLEKLIIHIKTENPSLSSSEKETVILNYFLDMTEEKFQLILKFVDCGTLIEEWRSGDVRRGKDIDWKNAL